jgi:hypothetical protein
MSRDAYSFLKATGLSNESVAPMSELVEAFSRDRMVTFCSSDKCNRGIVNRLGVPVHVGETKACPFCKSTSVMAHLCSIDRTEKARKSIAMRNLNYNK